MPNGLNALLWFAVVVAAIPLALWLLKRTPLGTGASAGVMKSIAMLPLSTSQRIVTVEVGSGDDRRWLVLGVTPTAITTLHTMAPAMPPAPATPIGTPPGAVTPATFGQLLARVRDRKGSDAG